MDLNAQAKEVMDQLGKYASPPMETLSPRAARNLPLLDYAVRDLVASKTAKRMHTVTTPMPEQIASITHQCIQGPGGEILLRFYTPEGTGPFPVLVYFHGGGWVIASPNHYDSSARALCKAAECIVVSVAYRQAPEHKYPAAAEDAHAATQWVMKNAPAFQGDPLRVAVGGESAGGNLATVACLMARDKRVLMPVHQLLVYPVTNFSFDTDSYREHSHAAPLNAAMMHWFWGHYLETEADGQQSYASPLQSTDLSGLPTATVITAEIDPLRDDGRAYAKRLQEAHVPVHYHHYDGVMHEFFGLAALVDQARDAVSRAAEELRRSFRAKGEDGPMPVEAQVTGFVPATS
ncbi:MAG: alpha/beta hydrolase [Bryobacteraceae bacterium]